MKNFTKILIVAICAILLTALAVVAISANSSIENDATFKELYVSTGGNVKMHFVYSDLGSATKMVADVYAPGAEQASAHYEYAVGDLVDNTVSVPLAPSEMAYIVKVYAEDTQGKGAERAYSVVQYANAILNSTSDRLTPYHNSMRTLLNWGALAEQLFAETESTINAGLFSRNSNPATDVVEFCDETGTDTTTDENVIKFAGRQVFLEKGNTRMAIYFDYQGEGELTATVQKADGTPVSVPVWKDGDTGYYFVNINNLGVAVFDAKYTVTMTDKTNTATATKTVLEYLNVLAFDTAHFDEAQRTLAKSMYQFYAQANNKVDAAACEHEIGFFTREAGDGVNEQLVCSNCFTAVDTFPASLKYYSYQTNIIYYNAEDPENVINNTNNAPIVEDGVRFTRAPGRTDHQNVSTDLRIPSTPIGQYLIVKYRAFGVAEGDSIRINVSINGGAVKAGTDSTLTEDEWEIAAIDISGAAGYAEAVAAGSATFKVEFYHTCGMDLAYVAVADSLGGFAGIMEEDETIENRGTSFGNAGYMVDQSGECVAHAPKITTEAVEGGKLYHYNCAGCGNKLAEDKLVKSDIIYFANASLSDRNGTNTATITVKAEDGVVFASSTPTASGGTADVILPYLAAETHGKYVAIKYRVSEGTSLNFNMMTGGTQNSQGAITTHPSEWTVAIMDVSGLGGYNATSGGALYWFFQHNGTLDVAYVAMSDNIASLTELVGENEQIFHRGGGTKPFANISGQVEIDKNGNCLGEHAYTVTSTLGADGLTTYTYNCPCGATKSKSGIMGDFADYKYYDSGTNSYPAMATQVVDGLYYATSAYTGATLQTTAPTVNTTAKYLVIKYRLGSEDATTGLRLLFKVNGSSQQQQIVSAANVKRDQWMIAVVDISSYAGTGDASTWVRFQHIDTLDLAYVALADDADDIAALLEDGETYVDCGNTFVNAGTGTVKDKNGNCLVHNPTFAKDTSVSGYISYTWTCSACSAVVSKRTVTTTEAYFAGTSAAAGNGQITSISNKFEDGVGYRHIVSQSNLGYSEIKLTGATLGRYLIVKYRVTDNINDGSVYFQLYHGNYTSIHKGTLAAPAQTDGWVVAIIDLANKSQYQALNTAGTTTGLQFILRIGNGPTIDVAYAAMSDDLDYLRSFLADGETYYDRGEDLGNVSGQIEKDKNGICLTHSVSTTKDESVAGYITYNYTCSKCSVQIPSRTVADTLAYVNGSGAAFAAQNGSTSASSAGDNTTSYRNIKNTNAVAWVQATVENATLGAYVAIKYRVPSAPSDPSAYVRFDFNLNDTAVCGGQVITNHCTEDWVVVILHIGGNKVYKELMESGATTAKMTVSFQNSSKDAPLQVAYAAMGSLEELQALLADGETYMDRGVSFTNVATQVEYNKDGTPVAAQ